MTFVPAIEEDLEIIDENDPYFIGVTDQWRNKPDGSLVFGYTTEYNHLIITAETYEMLGDPEEYTELSTSCDKYNCISDTELSSRGRDDLYDLGWCSGCHETAKEIWEELIENNPEVSLPTFL